MLSDKQKRFLSVEFGIFEFNADKITSEELWQLSEDCFAIECDEDRSEADRDDALELFYCLQKMLPKEWQFITPPEVAAMHDDKVSSREANKINLQSKQKMSA